MPIPLRPVILLSTSLVAATPLADTTYLPGSKNLSQKAQLGQQLFFDSNLSEPAGQSCASCHDPQQAFTDPDNKVPTSQGVLPGLQGNRNTPTAMYAGYAPAFHFDRNEGLFVGGQFLDGRAGTLQTQAKGPFLNPLEMANPNAATVVAKVKQADYAALFEQVYGSGALDDATQGYERIADAIAAFERSPVLNRFSSKYDYFLNGKATLTAQELRGRQVFENEDQGNCAACHPSRPSSDGLPPLFTDHTYDNIGVPKNPDNPFYGLQADLNPAGYDFIDKGLGATAVNDVNELGKFKVPTLRNIAKTAPYMHNGYFKTLEGVVAFYNNRDLKPQCANAMTADTQAIKQRCWPAPEVARNINVDELGNLNMDPQDIKDLVAFLKTLTDGYRTTSPWRFIAPKKQ